VAHRDAAVGLLLPIVVVAHRLPLAVFDVDVAAVVDHTTIVPMVQPLGTRLFEHIDSHQSRHRLPRDCQLQVCSTIPDNLRLLPVLYISNHQLQSHPPSQETTSTMVQVTKLSMRLSWQST
jgi:hypothetical protein